MSRFPVSRAGVLVAAITLLVIATWDWRPHDIEMPGFFVVKTEVEPVTHRPESNRSAAPEPIITRDLRVRLKDVSLWSPPEDLEVVPMPGIPPGWLILRAADPAAAHNALAALRNRPGVAEADVLVARQQSHRGLPDDPGLADQWHLTGAAPAAMGSGLNITSVWNYPDGPGTRGAGIRIGIVDDGIESTHEDLAANVDPHIGYDWNDDDNDPSAGPGNFHGTACAGVVAARGGNGIGVCGVAPEATLVGLRLIAGPTTDAQEAAAIAWRNDVIHIKNNSWGPADTGNLLIEPGPMTRSALATATAHGRGGLGTILVWAAGNGGEVGDNSNYDGYANSIHTIAIGASDSLGAPAAYSERGANILASAPSSGTAATLGITTTDRSGPLGFNTAPAIDGGNYTDTFGNTSAAAAMASGVIALMLETNPSLGWRDVREILIRSSSRLRPHDPEWIVNGAGFQFHPKLGAGKIDAAAAVALAADWTSLSSATSETRTATALALTIPENQIAGVTKTFDLPSPGLRCEQVTLKVNISHTSRGNLDITLTSPAGTVSRLAETHTDLNDHYTNWTFSSVRHWGEGSAGQWTLRVADRSGVGNTTGGTLNSAELTIHGVLLPEGNPPPAVAITSPANGSTFSPGTEIEVHVTATDLTAAGTAGEVTTVTLYANDVPLSTLTNPPFQFQFSPIEGDHQLIARATDSEGGIGSSELIVISVVNRAPIISAVHLDALGLGYADTGLSVAHVQASDPDGDPLELTYQWQMNSDGISFMDAPGETSATLAAAAHRSGKIWRCQVTATDGGGKSATAFSAGVNLLDRPRSHAMPGETYHYQSGLVLRAVASPSHRQAVIHEVSFGPSGGNSQWIELLTLQQADLRYWDLTAGGNLLVFVYSGVWQSIPAGTLIVIYNGQAPKDPMLPPDDFDPADGRMVLSSTSTAYFSSAFDPWISLPNAGTSISLNDGGSATVHQLAYGNGTAQPHIGALGAGTAAFFSGNTGNAFDAAESWNTTSADGTVSPGLPNTPAGSAFITALRNGTPDTPAAYRLAPGSTLPAGLSLDPESGSISGLIAADVPFGSYEIHIERHNSASETVSQAFTLEIGPVGGFEAWINRFAGITETHPGDDPDRDGLPNLVEYGMDTPPDSPGPLMWGDQDESLSITYRESKVHQSVRLIPEWSRSLDGDWNATGVTLTELEADARSRVIRASVIRNPAEPRAFLRLRAMGHP